MLDAAGTRPRARRQPRSSPRTACASHNRRRGIRTSSQGRLLDRLALDSLNPLLPHPRAVRGSNGLNVPASIASSSRPSRAATRPR
jgi:hypothetical protein